MSSPPSSPSSKRRLEAFLIAAAIAASAGLSARAASAALPLVVTSQEALDGLHEYSTVTVKSGGRLVVTPLGAGVGWLHLRANAITVEAGGEIDATGAGYQGVDSNDGGQPNGTTGAGKLGGGVDKPGTGGANKGNGGLGTNGACAPINATQGGAAYMMPGLIEMGSAGGAAKVADPSVPTRGGHGGGRITLEAASITIAGVVAARGEDGLNPSNVGSGGGAGGVVELIGWDISGAGTISVHGGAGGSGKLNGGGGGGGLLLLSTKPAAMITLALDFDGGQSGACPANGAGGKGSAPPATAIAACVDADKDGFTAAACGGDDCDDSDPEIHPAKNGVSVLERCDGQDNDCDGSIDNDLPPGACPGGSCQAGACVPEMTGAGGGTDVGARPDHVEYIGGCAVALGERSSAGGASNERGGFERDAQNSGAFAALAALLFAARRGRRRRLTKRLEPSSKTGGAPGDTATALDASRRARHTGPPDRSGRTLEDGGGDGGADE